MGDARWECQSCRYPRNPANSAKCYNCGSARAGSAPDARRLSVPGGLLAAKGKYGLKVELTDDAIRYVLPGRPVFSYRGEVVVPISAIVDVYWTDPFLKVGDGVFGIVAPGALPTGIWPSKRGRAGALFGRSDSSDFKAIYDVLLSVVLEARRKGADMIKYLISSDPTPMTAPGIPGTQLHTGLRIGDVNAQFDIETAGRITGSLSHEYLGRFGSMDYFGGDLHLGSFALTGSSTVDLSVTATSRANLLNQAFVAVFDAPSAAGVQETLRVVVPTDEVCRQLVPPFVISATHRMGPVAPPARQLEQLLKSLNTRVATEVNYALDRTNAVLRLPPESRPTFDVVGMPIGPGAILGGAIRIQGDPRWLQLVPFGLIYSLGEPADGVRLAREQTLSVPSPETAAPPVPPGPASGAAMKICPACAEEVKAAALICRYCRYEFGPLPHAGEPAAQP